MDFRQRYDCGPGYPTKAEAEQFERQFRERQARIKGQATIEQARALYGEAQRPAIQPTAQALWDAAFAAIGITLHGARQ
jgi:hypothetical protein